MNPLRIFPKSRVANDHIYLASHSCDTFRLILRKLSQLYCVRTGYFLRCL